MGYERAFQTSHLVCPRRWQQVRVNARRQWWLLMLEAVAGESRARGALALLRGLPFCLTIPAPPQRPVSGTEKYFHKVLRPCKLGLPFSGANELCPRPLPRSFLVCLRTSVDSGRAACTISLSLFVVVSCFLRFSCLLALSAVFVVSGSSLVRLNASLSLFGTCSLSVFK